MAITLDSVALGLPTSDPNPAVDDTFTMRLDTTSSGHGADNNNSLHFETSPDNSDPWEAIDATSAGLQSSGTNPQTWSSATTQYSITVTAAAAGTYYLRGRSSGDDGPYTTSSQVITITGPITADGAATLTALTASGTATNHRTLTDGTPSIPAVTAAGTATNHRTLTDNAPALAPATASGTATNHRTLTDGTPVLGASTASGTATVSAGGTTHTANGAATVTALTASGTATNHRTLTDNAPTLTAIMAAGTATAPAGGAFTIAGGGFGEFYFNPSGKLIQVY